MITSKLWDVPYCAPIILGYFALVCNNRAVLYHASVVLDYSLPVCIDRAMLYQAALLLRAILHSCMLCVWSRELGVLWDLKLTLVILVWRKKIHRVWSMIETPLNIKWMTMWTYSCVEFLGIKTWDENGQKSIGTTVTLVDWNLKFGRAVISTWWIPGWGSQV